MIKSRKIKLLKWLAGISIILLMLGISAVTVFAVFDVAVEYQNGRANIKKNSNKCIKRFLCLFAVRRCACGTV